MFTINPVAPAAVSGIQLTDESGKTHVSVPNGNGTYTDVTVGDPTKGIAAIDLYANISYSGDLTVVDSVNALWQASCTTVKLTLSCTGAAGTAAIGAAATTDVKFVSGASDYTVDSSDPGLVSIAANSFSFTAVNSATANVKVGTVYIAIRGSNDVVWTGAAAANHPSYTLTLAASHV